MRKPKPKLTDHPSIQKHLTKNPKAAEVLGHAILTDQAEFETDKDQIAAIGAGLSAGTPSFFKSYFYLHALDRLGWLPLLLIAGGGGILANLIHAPDVVGGLLVATGFVIHLHRKRMLRRAKFNKKFDEQ